MVRSTSSGPGLQWTTLESCSNYGSDIFVCSLVFVCNLNLQTNWECAGSRTGKDSVSDPEDFYAAFLFSFDLLAR